MSLPPVEKFARMFCNAATLSNDWAACDQFRVTSVQSHLGRGRWMAWRSYIGSWREISNANWGKFGGRQRSNPNTPVVKFSENDPMNSPMAFSVRFCTYVPKGSVKIPGACPLNPFATHSAVSYATVCAANVTASSTLK